MNNASFYSQISSFDDFLEFAQSSHYVPAPRDWFLLIADVKSSTKAIAEGKYKTVNMAGASAIVALANCFGSMDFPFVFGGDGATALLPPEQLEKTKSYLRTVRRQALQVFDLDLRLGLVPIEELAKHGFSVEVAKFALQGGPKISFFQGTGIGEGEAWVKAGRFHVEEGLEADPAEVLKGLSCRWAPLKNTRGCILALIVKARQQERAGELLTPILERIDAIAHLASVAAHPIKPEEMKSESLLLASKLEARFLALKQSWRARIAICLQILFVRVARMFNLRISRTKIREYLNDNRTHSDYRKYDDMLRLVFDCSEGMKERVTAVLEEAFHKQEIFYGVSSSDSALLTCFIVEMQKGKHIHFVDGNNGGYTMASKQMKEQMAASRSRV